MVLLERKMKKYYLINIKEEIGDKYYKKFKEGQTIIFEMPSFCSGDYEAKIYKDENGLYINKENNFFKSCRDFEIK